MALGSVTLCSCVCVCVAALEATRLSELSTQLTAEAKAAKKLAETEANERHALQVGVHRALPLHVLFMRRHN